MGRTQGRHGAEGRECAPRSQDRWAGERQQWPGRMLSFQQGHLKQHLA
ncbi:hypothetical protein SAMN00790413_04573 [Deinococcus hopiensis KR-140]|uniref:Uncharacterized protein n=1 Tax=Deinococcus hopiensis KR-140 TaxID=695939 RepID=A0A1W1UK55_9DEIO|nr:hypothetical protein SAMN00790413_04573 [Deinococcus hopiensis KR-140]